MQMKFKFKPGDRVIMDSFFSGSMEGWEHYFHNFAGTITAVGYGSFDILWDTSGKDREYSFSAAGQFGLVPLPVQLLI